MRKYYKLSGKTGYYMNLPNEKGKLTRKKIADTKKKADEYLAKYFEDNKDGAYGDPLFEIVAIAWVEDSLIPRLKDGDLSQVFKDRAATACDRFETAHPGLTVGQVTPLVVTKWLADKSANYRRTEYGMLKQCLQWAEDYGMIRKSPLSKLKLPPNQPLKETEVIELETHQKILTYVHEDAKLLLELLWHTGARPSELAGLQWEWIDAKLDTATLPKHKTRRKGKLRRIYFNKAAKAILRKCKKRYKGDYVLLNSIGNPWNKDSIRLILDRVVEAGGPKTNAYAYRHTYATRALASGEIDIATAAELLGHSSTEMIMRKYAHLNQVKEHMKVAVKRLS